MLDDKVLALVDGSNFAVLSTKNPDGSIQSHPMWWDTDGTYIRINTERERQKFRNLSQDSNVTVLIQKNGNPWHWVEIRGQVVETIGGPEGRTHIDTLAKKYLGVDDYPNPIASERMMVKIIPERVVAFGPMG